MARQGIPPPIKRVFDQEELAGLRLATWARTAILAVLAVQIAIFNRPPAVYVFEVEIAIFAGLGLTHYALRRRFGPAWIGYLFVTADMVLLVVVLVATEISLISPWPPQMIFRSDNFMYFFIIIAGVALTYTPRLMVWSSIAAVVAWGAAAAWIALLPETVTEFSAVPSPGSDLAGALDPHFVRLTARIEESVVALIVGGTLAIVVSRSRRLVIRQAASARERANLSRYFPPTIVERLADTDAPLGPSRSQPIAVLFADIVGFSRIAERRQPDRVIALLREFHGRMERAVFDNRGTLDKFLGDGLMVTFGTPDPGPRDAGNAVRCAYAMLAAVDEWNRDRRHRGVVPIALSIGVHFGTVVLGDIGSARRLEFAVLGDAVNVASRLESVTRELGVRMAVSGQLASAVRNESAADADALLSRLAAAGSRTLRGRGEPIAVWTL